MKKLTDICGILYGYPFDSACFTDDASYMPLIRIRDVMKGFSQTYYKGSIPEGYYIEKGDYLIGMDGEFNIASWNSNTALLNQRVCKIYSKTPSTDIRYIYYFMTKCLKRIEDETPFVTVKHLSAKRLNQIDIMLPPLSEQQRIVSELDCISGIIEKKKQQLTELDNLAQAIFYDMFGDPIQNEKGWEVKKLGEVFQYIKNGANIKQEKGAKGFPITRIETLSGGVFNRDRLGYANVFDIDRYENYVLDDMDLLLSHINSKLYIGRTVVYHKQKDERIIHGMNLLRLKPNDIVHSVYVKYFFDTCYFKEQIVSIRKDAVNQSSIAVGDIKRLSILIPPLPLQQSFAAKIAAIEEQKALIRRSIAETEALFGQRMDYYFN